MTEQPNQLDRLIANISKPAGSKEKMNIVVGIRFNKKLDEIFESSRHLLNVVNAIDGKEQLDKSTFLRLCAYIGAQFVIATINDMTDKKEAAETET